jgi:predicted phage tail protein
MLTVRLHGHLEERYGSEFKFAASTVREVIDALQANFPDFTEEFIKDERAYSVIIDSEAQQLYACYMPIKTDSTIDIIPAIGGAGFGKALGMIFIAFLLLFPPTAAAIGAAAAAGGTGAFAGAFGAVLQGASAAAVIGGTTTVAATLGAITAVGLQAMAWGLALAGVASLLAGPDGPDGGGAKSSTLNQSENIVGQGMPIPVGYGRLMVGSLVLSSTSTSSYSETSKAWTYENTQLGTWQDVQMNTGPAENVSGGTTKSDGYVTPITVYPGFTETQLAEVNSLNESYIGGGTYEVVNTTTSAGTTAVSVYTPPKFSGVYTKDWGINHRANKE